MFCGKSSNRNSRNAACREKDIVVSDKYLKKTENYVILCYGIQIPSGAKDPIIAEGKAG